MKQHKIPRSLKNVTSYLKEIKPEAIQIKKMIQVYAFHRFVNAILESFTQVGKRKPLQTQIRYRN